MEKAVQLPSGRWRQRYTGPDGKRHSATDTSARKVQKKAALELAELVANHGKKTEEERTRTRFDIFAEEWLQTRRPGSPGGYAVSTYRKRLTHLADLNKTFGEYMVEDITPAQVRAWWNSRASTPSHRHTLYWFLSAIFEVAIDDELIHRNPCRVKDANQKPKRTRQTFTDAEQEKIHDAAEGEMKALLLILMGTALRIGELLALDWSDIAFLDSKLRVTKHLTPFGIQPGTKAGAERTRSIALPSWVREVLEGLYKGSEGEGPIFRNNRGGRLSIDGAERRFRKIREKAGVPTMRLHDCRHIALTRYARQLGVTLKDVMEFAGPLSERSAMSYQHVDDDRKQKIASEAIAPRWVKS